MRLFKYNLILNFLLLVFLVSCGNSGTPGVHTIQPTDVKKMIDNKENVLIIDVRTPPEYIGPLGHIPGSQLKPLQSIEQWMPEISDKKDHKIILVCRSGNRSGVAAKYLAKHGFKDVYNMVGGMKAWNEKHFPVELAREGDEK